MDQDIYSHATTHADQEITTEERLARALLEVAEHGKLVANLRRKHRDIQQELSRAEAEYNRLSDMALDLLTKHRSPGVLTPNSLPGLSASSLIGRNPYEG